MTIRARGALIQPNMYRRSMAYPRSGHQVITGYSAASFVEPDIWGLTPDPDTGELLGLRKGVGAADNGRPADRWVSDAQGMQQPILAGRLAWRGARYVQNLLSFSEDFSNAAWDKLSGASATADILTFGGVGANVQQNWPVVVFGSTQNLGLVNLTLTPGYRTYVVVGNRDGHYFTARVDLKAGTTDKCSVFLATTTSGVALVISEDGDFGAGVTIQAEKAQLEWTNRNAVRDVPSEYRSTDVAGSKGYAAFDYANGNVINGDVLSERRGGKLSPIPMLSHNPASTNICLQSNQFLTAPWTQQGGILNQDIDGLDGYPNSGWSLAMNTTADDGLRQSVAPAVSVNPCVGVFYIDRLNTTSQNAQFSINGADDTSYVRLNPQTGAEIEVSGTVSYTYVFLSARVAKVLVTDTDDLTPRLIRVDYDKSGTGRTLALLQVEFYDGVNFGHVLGLGANFTTTAPVSIPADQYSWDIANHDNDEVCYYCDWIPAYNYTAKNTNANVLSVKANGANGLAFDNLNPGVMRTHDEVNVSDVLNVLTASWTPVRVGVIASISDNKMQLCIDGEWGTEAAYSGYSVTGPLSAMWGSAFPMGMRELRRYDVEGHANQKALISKLMAEPGYAPPPPDPEPLVLENIQVFQEEEAGAGDQIVRKTMIEVEFNQNVLADSAAGVISSVQGSGQTINLVRGSGTPKLVYQIQRAIFRHQVTWGYNMAEGDIRAAYGGEKLDDVSDDPIANNLPQFTVHDWDAGAPNGFDTDTKFDTDQTRHDEV